MELRNFRLFMNKMQTQIAQNLGGIWSNLELQIVKGTEMHEITTQIPRSPINNVTISLWKLPFQDSKSALFKGACYVKNICKRDVVLLLFVSRLFDENHEVLCLESQSFIGAEVSRIALYFNLR